MIETFLATQPSVGEKPGGKQKNVTVSPKSDGEGGEDERRSLWDELGLPEPPFLDESRAPPLDRELIRQMVRHELPEEREKEVGKLVVLFKSWSDAHYEIILEEMARRRGKK